MKRQIWQAAVLMMCGFLVASALAATHRAAPKRFDVDTKVESSALRMAQTVTAITGIAISPLLGVSVIGAWQHFEAKPEARAGMSWYTQPWFWILGLLLTAVVACKDVAGAAVPTGLKKPFDVAEVFENKVSGLVAAGALLPMMSSLLGGMLASNGIETGHSALAFININTLQSILLFPFAMAVYGMVWLVSHAMNILILLSPWGVVDLALKSLRLAVLSLLSGVALIDPWLGALLSACVIFIAYQLAGWSFRLLVFGWVFSWDFVTRRHKRFTPAGNSHWCFATQRLAPVPVRTYGSLEKDGDTFVFRYRPWLVGAPRSHPLSSARLAVGNGFVYPTLIDVNQDKLLALFNFPPRYRNHESALAALCGIPVEDVGLLRGIKKVGFWLAELFGLKRAAPPSLALAAAAALLLLGSLTSVQAETEAGLTVEDLARQAELVVHGKVSAMACEEDSAGRLITRIDLLVLEAWKGSPNSVQIQVIHGGGTLGQRKSGALGQVEFALGEEAVLFLIRNVRSEMLVLGMNQGKFTVFREPSSGSELVWNRAQAARIRRAGIQSAASARLNRNGASELDGQPRDAAGSIRLQDLKRQVSAAR